MSVNAAYNNGTRGMRAVYDDFEETSVNDPTSTSSGLPQDLLTINEAAARLKSSRGFLYALMGRGRLPYIKLGRLRRVRLADLQHLIEQHTIGTEK